MNEQNAADDNGPVPDQFLDAIKVENNDLSLDDEDDMDVKLDQVSGNFQSEVLIFYQETLRRS